MSEIQIQKKNILKLENHLDKIKNYCPTMCVSVVCNFLQKTVRQFLTFLCGRLKFSYKIVLFGRP